MYFARFFHAQCHTMAIYVAFTILHLSILWDDGHIKPSYWRAIIKQFLLLIFGNKQKKKKVENKLLNDWAFPNADILIQSQPKTNN